MCVHVIYTCTHYQDSATPETTFSSTIYFPFNLTLPVLTELRPGENFKISGSGVVGRAAWPSGQQPAIPLFKVNFTSFLPRQRLSRPRVPTP